MSALLGLFGLGTLQVEAQSLPSEVTVFATATAQTDVNGQVAVSSEETTDPAYQDLKAEGKFQSTGYTMTQALPAGGLYVYAYYYAQPNDGYYFDHWVKVETGETFTEMPRLDSVLSAGTTANFDGTGAPYFFPFEETYKTSYQSVGTYTAVFKAVPVYSCTGGQLAYTSVGESKNWNVTFSTGFARSIDDFAEPVFTNVTAGGSFDADWSSAIFTDNDVIIPVSFTASAAGTYTADMTFSSVGGASFKAVLKVNVEAAAANDVLVKNGTKQLTLSWADGMTQAAAGDTIQLLRDLTLGSSQTITKGITLDLNGRRLGGMLDINGGDVTIMDSKMVGQIQSEGNTVTVTSGSLTLKRGEIIGKIAVTVKSGKSFDMIDGKLTATERGIDVTGGTVNMTSGEINVEGSTSEVMGILLNGGTLNLEGGKITAISGGSNAKGVAVNSGTVTAHNVRITASGTNATAVQSSSSGTLQLGQYAVLNATTPNNNAPCALRTAGNATIDGARFSASNNTGDVSEIQKTGGNLTVVSGYFVVDEWVNTYTLASNQAIYNLGAGQAYADGYRYFIGTSENAKDDAVSVCAIGTTAYGTLEEALLYAQNNPSKVLTILMLNNYTLPAGYYTLPANATLLVPAAASQKKPFGGQVSRTQYASAHSEFRRLTFASGAHLDVYGKIEASGYQYCGQVTQPGTSATSTGAYGLIALNSGSTMTLEDGAVMYAWGFITGDGEIHARRGSQVREFFQVYDWPGAGNAFTIYQQASEKKLFPLNQYFIQNIEAATVYHPGSRLYTSFAATGAGITAAADNIQIVGLTGENAMYLMDPAADAENTWVRKWYDVTNDKQVYDVNSGAHLGSMVIALPMLQAMGMSSFDSKLFVLPLTSNMKIHLLTGAMDITQSTQMLPGTEIEVDKEATVTLNPGVSLYMYDTDQWDMYARNAYAQVIGFTPSWNGKPTARDVSSLNAIGDAKLNVHGTFDVKGRLLTTTSGANIFSNNADAGTIRFTTAAPASADDKLYQFKVGAGISEPIATVPALLRNSAGQDPAFADSKSTPAGQTYCFFNDMWRMMTDADPFVYDNFGAWYVKPGAYVSIVTQTSTTEAIGTEPRMNADHTYSDAAGDGRLFILVDNQWWEVTLVNNLYRGTNGKYYVYDDNDGAYDEPRWHEKQFFVHFVNWDGSEIATSDADATIYELSYGSMPFYNGTNPTRAEDVDYTYTFTGWMPTFVPVTEDATYTATYEATQRKYTIIFLDENGKEIERHFLTRDEMPECKNTPSKTGYFLTWSPGIGAVVGDQTYQAVFTPEPPTEFTITFKNYDGSELQTFTNVKEGTPLAGLYTGGTPTKPATAEYTYTFAGWQPAIGTETVASADMSFTAQFTSARQTAEVTFEDENGNQIGAVQYVEVGQTPVAPEYTKTATAEYTYTVTWIPAVSAVVSATPVTYYADITAEKNKYTVKVTTENCTVIGAGTYEYGENVTLSLVPATGYTSAKWDDNTTGDKVITVDGDITLSATGITGDEPEQPEEPKDMVVTSTDVKTITEPTTVANLTIEASATAAGQIIGTDKLQLAEGGNAYYKYIFNAAATTWYDFAVPFECNGATVKAGNSTLTLGKDYHIISFNGATRATIADEDKDTDNSAWEFLSKQADKTLVPGRLYMIYFFAAQRDVTFTKKAGASIVYNGTVTVNEYTNGGAATALARNWNGIANWTLYTAQLNTGTVYGQFYVPASESYDTRAIANEQFYVGKPVFVQVDDAATVTAQLFTSSAPVRRSPMYSQECIVTISDNAKETDHVYLLASEDALDEYVIGQDLAKVGISSKVAQMWVNRYNAKLCVNTMSANENDMTEYPLGIFAPKAGAYTIAAPQSEAGMQVVLMYNGVEIADLTRGEYTIDLARGTTTSYAIRISGKRGTPTAIGDAVADTEKAQKVISNGVLYILRGGNVYDAQGRMVK